MCTFGICVGFMFEGEGCNTWYFRMLRILLMPFAIAGLIVAIVLAILFVILAVVISPIWYAVTGENLITKLGL